MTEQDTAVPEHITPHSIAELDTDQLEALMETLRERRLASVRQYEAAQKAAKEAADEKARAALMKQCDMCANNIERVEKALAALETRVTKIRALRMELELD